MRRILVYLPLLLLSLAFTVQTPKRTIFMVGDSTMANKSAKAFPETGWGQALSAFADTSRIQIQNHAQNGRSTKSFIDQGLWAKVESQIKPGDYVFIQFGHNDQKRDKPTVYARAETTYQINLKMMIEQTRAKGGVPVLFTSVVRRDFMENGKLRDTHGAYIDAAKAVAAETKTVLIDMEALTHLLVEKYGVEASKQLYLHLAKGQYDTHPEGLEDNTHLSKKGALEFAALAVENIKRLIPELANCF